MASLNLFKGGAGAGGYDQVNQLENQRTAAKRPTTASSSTVITVSAVVIFTLVIGLTLPALMLEPVKEPAAANSAESIRTACNVTRFPDSCFATLSSLNASVQPDPEAILGLSLHVAIAHLSNLSSSLKSINDLRSQPALTDCLTLFDDALSRLNDSVSVMKKVKADGETVLSKGRISDIQTWISAAMSDQDTCNDGLEEMGWTADDDKVKSQLQSCKETVSNSLAIVANMQNLYHKFGLTMH